MVTLPLYVPLMALLVIVVSPAAMLVIRNLYEGGKPHMGFAPQTDSWAYLFGDTLALPVSLAAASYAAPQMDWLFAWWWMLASIVVGIGFSVWFRKFDSGQYIAQGHGDRLDAPTKVWHDYVVYPVIASLLCWLGIPAAMTGTTAGWLAIGGFVAWLILCGLDMYRGLKPEQMHPRVQDTIFGES